MTIERVTLALVAAAVVRRSAAKSPGTFAVGSRPRPSENATVRPWLTTFAPILPPWVLHDLRRTARSLMSRAGVLSEHAERVLGHVIRGVEGIYDRHRYFDEKADALNRLASLVGKIINPPMNNVVEIGKRKRRR